MANEVNNESKFVMSISLNILNHLGINLYSNTPAVLSEVIANSWDAGATVVSIDIDTDKQTVTISDNGCGMTEKELNEKFLHVGYERRKNSQENKHNRQIMGRKGIGKLSLFSIANRIHIQSKKDNEENAFLMDAEEVKQLMDENTPEKIEPYKPKEAKFNSEILKHETGTAIQIPSLKKQLTRASVSGLKKRLARRFSIIGDKYNFKIYLNEEEVTFADRNYFHKARFLFQYGDESVADSCSNLDKDENDKDFVFSRENKFDEQGNPDSNGNHEIKGWIAIAHRSNDLDDNSSDDNLNNIVLVVRGKVAQEDVFHQFRLGSLFTKYVYGEVQADFLDDDEEPDIAVTSRQRISEDAPRYKALRIYIKNELLHIRTETDRLKRKKGVEKALNYSPKIKEWYEDLSSKLKRKADAIFGTIEQIEIDERHKATLYVNGILAFEKMKMQSSLDDLENIGPNQLEGLLKIFNEADDIEAAHYYEIVSGRISKIEKLQQITKNNEKERIIQEYIFDHLWLLDPAWERATSEAKLESAIQAVINSQKSKDSQEVQKYRIDIQYKKVSGAHVIIELKRASRKLKKTELEEQIKRYIDAVKNKLSDMGREGTTLIEGICIVGKTPDGWDNKITKKQDIESLRPYGIRILTYDELIDNAYSAYSKFIEKQEEVGRLRMLIKEIRTLSDTKQTENESE